MKDITRNDIEYVQQTISKDGSVWTAKYSDNSEYRKQVVSVVLLREVLKDLDSCVQRTENFDAIEWYLVKEAFSGVFEDGKKA